MKKLYYEIDNGDTSITCDLSALLDIIQGESDTSEPKDSEDSVQWTITQIWLTDEEFKNLPEAE